MANDYDDPGNIGELPIADQVEYQHWADATAQREYEERKWPVSCRFCDRNEFETQRDLESTGWLLNRHGSFCPPHNYLKFGQPEEEKSNMTTTFLTPAEMRTIAGLDAPVSRNNKAVIDTQMFGKIAVAPLRAAAGQEPAAYWARCIDARATSFAKRPSEAVLRIVISLGIARTLQMANIAAAA